MPCKRTIAALIFCAVAFAPVALLADQQSSPASPAGQPSAGSSPSSSNAEPPPFNPLPAEKDVEVATFYMRKGDPDASIPRLEEAIQLDPNYAKPRLLLGEIYEKKGDKQDAVKYYRQYLRVYPHAPDAKKIEGRISKLSK
ncbi:MAG TPA: tetratricopeptide repeat protein [Candidatus Aquilonibacter sp.]|nr:tetratricopeptide repeat protein [Candidatus Aquilonibacter sp.]